MVKKVDPTPARATGESAHLDARDGSSGRIAPDLARFWEALLEGMRRRIGAEDVQIWLQRGRPLALDPERGGSEPGVLWIEVENRYYADWITENLIEALNEEADIVLGRAVRVELAYRDDPVGDDSHAGADPDVERPPQGIGINAGQTFDNFVIGECNKFAHAAASAVADHPGRNYNPLFIYGSTGLGKTHLMHAVANRVLSQRHDARVVYVTAEDFMNEMINCLRYKRMDDFRGKYRKHATVLLVDDVQFLGGRDRTQEEFFHTFNALQNMGKQIILTSDVVPADIEKLEPRLRTRFEGGLLADMQPPDRETLLAILHQKADNLRLRLPTDLADAIAGRLGGDIRSLEGMLNRLQAVHNFDQSGAPLTLEWARAKLPGLFDAPRATVTVAGIIEAVAKFHNLRSADITGNKRTRTLTRPRHIAMYLARMHTTLSFPELGREFGDRDHSTIQHGFKKTKEELDTDPDLAYRVKLIEQQLLR